MSGSLQTVSNEISQGDGCFRYTIPIVVARELDLAPGDEPDVEWDSDEQEITLSF